MTQDDVAVTGEPITNAMCRFTVDRPVYPEKSFAYAIAETTMYYLYGSKPGMNGKLVAVFDSEPRLLSYVNWAELKANPDGTRKFEQGSVLGGFNRFEHSATPLTDEDDSQAPYGPTPSML